MLKELVREERRQSEACKIWISMLLASAMLPVSRMVACVHERLGEYSMNIIISNTPKDGALLLNSDGGYRG